MKDMSKIKGIMKKLGKNKEEVLKICNENLNKDELKEKMKTYTSDLTNEEIEKLCLFFTSERELSQEELDAVSGGFLY